MNAARDKQGPESKAIIGVIGHGKTTLLRHMSLYLNRTVMIDFKGDSEYPGMPPELISNDIDAVVRAIARPRRVNARMDVVYHPVVGYRQIRDTKILLDVIGRLLDAVEKAARASGWITVIFEEMAVLTENRGFLAELQARVAVRRRGATDGHGGWSFIVSAQSAAYIPPSIRRLLSSLIVGCLSIDDEVYMTGRWNMKKGIAADLFSRAQKLHRGQWLRLDAVTGKVTNYDL